MTLTRKVKDLSLLGDLQAGDVIVGERVDGTTVRLTYTGSSGGGAVDSVNGQTGVVVLDADDIADAATANKFTSAADETRLADTSGTNTGDQTSIVGITGTKAEFNISVTDGNFLYSGDITQYTDELAQDATGAMIDTSLNYVDGTPLLQRAALTGDVTASAGSNATTIANDVVTYAKMQNVSATDKILGRSSALAGDVEEITCTAAGRALIDDADASAQRTTLGLGTLATQSGTFSGTSSGTNTGDQTSIVGITGTKAEFNTAVSDGNILYVGDAYVPSGTDVALADGGTGASLTDPNADRVMFWDDSGGAVDWLTMGTNLSITGTTLNATGGSVLVQSVSTSTGAVATGTTLFTQNDTIPTNTAGTEFITLAITPTSSSNILKITAVLNMRNSATTNQTMALFQDSTANALAVAITRSSAADSAMQLVIRYTMTAGTTSSTTFKVRAGGSSAGTTTLNGLSAARLYGGVLLSTLDIKETTP